MHLFDTYRQQPVAFEPPTDQPVGIYTCGVTPYDAAHAGHIFTFLVFDLLQRRLEDTGHTVHLVRNITDVDDPLYAKAAELGIDYRQLAERETARLQQVLDQLNFRPAYAEPRASQYILAMSEAVTKLLQNGHAYWLDGDVYYDVASYPAFAVATIPNRLQTAVMADRGGDPTRPGKRQPLDFLLWHGVSDSADQAAWQTELGRGRPGWHIECSVMSQQLLGTPFTLHGGGNDLIFPHHACERAQTAGLATTGSGDETSLSQYWLHIAPLALYGDKMSKSLGNLVFAHDLLQTYSPNTVRLALMQYDHRTGGEWRDEFLATAERLAQAIDNFRPDAPTARQLLTDVRTALDDNIDMPAIVRRLTAVMAETDNRPIDPTIGFEPAWSTTKGLLGLV